MLLKAAVPTVGTGVTTAAVYFLLAVGAHITRRAAAGVTSSRFLHAGSAIEARSVRTGHCADLAVLSVKALRARA